MQFSRTTPINRPEPQRPNPPPSLERQERARERATVERMQQDPVWTCENILGAKTLWQKQKEILHSITVNRRTSVASAHGIGKALALDTPIPIPSGWTTMEDLETGDEVFDEQGRVCDVENTTEVWEDQDCYEVEFDDGSTIVCSGDHLWSVLPFQTRSDIRSKHRHSHIQPVKDWREMWAYCKVHDTRSMASSLETNLDQLNWSVPCSKPLTGFFDPSLDLIPPYTLGAWLGDGTTVTNAITASHEDGQTILTEIRKEGVPYHVVPSSTKEGKNHATYLLEGIRPRLRELGVLGNKHIPRSVLRSPLSYRLSVLQGIMDTDGFAMCGNSVGTDLMNKHLAYGVVELARTFGWKVRCERRPAKLYGRIVGDKYRINFRPNLPVFRLQRKLDRTKEQVSQESRHTIRTITDIRSVPSVPTKCITVNSPSRLYLAGKTFVPTHNSYTAARAAVSFLLTHANSIVPTTAPTDRQVKKVLWQEIHKTRGEMTVPCRTSPLVKEWQVAPGWFALGLSCKDPDAFQGLHASSGDILIIIDEASGVPDEIWDAAAGSLSSQKARLLSIGNPTNPSGAFAKEFRTPGVKTFNISAFDTPNFTAFGITMEDLRTGAWQEKVGNSEMPYPGLVTPIWASEMLNSWGEESPLFIAKVKGQFPKESEDSVILLEWVERARRRWMEFEDAEDTKNSLVPETPVELGLDVARFGRNETVLAIRRGNRCGIHSRWRGKDTMQTVAKCVEAMQSTKASCIKVDDSGVGGGVTDRLKQLKVPVEPINAGTKARDDTKFFNARAEMWWNARELLRLDSLLIESTKDFSNDSILDGQLCAPRYSFDLKNRIKIESKEDMEDRGIQSPDRADALLLALYPSKRRSGPICW